MSFLKKLQSKSSAVKTQYAFGIASVLTGVIALFWLSTLPTQFAQVTEEGNVIQENPQGLSDLLKGANEQLSNIIDSVNEETEAVSEDTYVAPSLDALNMNEQVILDASPQEVIAPPVTPPSPNEETYIGIKNSTGAKTTEKKKVLIEVTKQKPNTILVSTSTSRVSE